MPPAPATRDRWIESPAFDTLLFAAAPLTGLAFMLVVLSGGFFSRYSNLLFFAVGMAHYFTTFSFFLGDANLAHYKTRALAFFGGPALILLGVAALRFGPGLYVLLAIIYVWNAWHVLLQSCGILSLYRHKAGGPRDEKPWANAAVISVGFALLFWSVPEFEPLRSLEMRVAWWLPDALFAAAAFVALIAVGAYVFRIIKRTRAGQPMSFAELLALAAALLIFHPYAWVRNTENATAGMLIGHFVQYLALVWLLNRRKYADAVGSRRQNVLRALVRRPPLIAATLLSLTAAVYAFDRGMRVIGHEQIYFWLWNSLALSHFYLDGLIWSFKNPYVRTSMAPYLSGGRPPALTPAVAAAATTS